MSWGTADKAKRSRHQHRDQNALEYCLGRFDHALRRDEEPENEHIGGTLKRDTGE